MIHFNLKVQKNIVPYLFHNGEIHSVSFWYQQRLHVAQTRDNRYIIEPPIAEAQVQQQPRCQYVYSKCLML